MCTAVLLDTVSIQRYVFGSNKLKENIGASYLVQWIFDELLRETVGALAPEIKMDVFDDWREKKHEYDIRDDKTQFEVGYIGGGNALLFFKDKKMAIEFVEIWTAKLLIETPGIMTAVSIKEIDLNDFKNARLGLFKQLNENKFKFIPQTIVPRHGITAICPRSGYSQEVWHDDPDSSQSNYISGVTKAKLDASRKANKLLENEFEKVLKNDFIFSDQLDHLGQSKGKDSHIAIVHIDGNGMGKRFEETSSLEETRSLSIQVHTATITAFTNMLKTIISRMTELAESLGLTGGSFPKDETNGKIILPLRPVIIGGDDITFVAEGRLGIFIAKMFLEEFAKQPITIGESLSACAGIAITKTKYPFYRGYILAEQLCASAKKCREEKKDSGSWIDFHISYGGFSGDIEDIRKKHYMAPQGKLWFRPYKINDSGSKGFYPLIRNANVLKAELSPKIKEMRQILSGSESHAREFIATLQARGTPLKDIFPELKGYHEKLWESEGTPFFDMIEILDFYPDSELKREKRNAVPAV